MKEKLPFDYYYTDNPMKDQVWRSKKIVFSDNPLTKYLQDENFEHARAGNYSVMIRKDLIVPIDRYPPNRKDYTRELIRDGPYAYRYSKIKIYGSEDYNLPKNFHELARLDAEPFFILDEKAYVAMSEGLFLMNKLQVYLDKRRIFFSR